MMKKNHLRFTLAVTCVAMVLIAIAVCLNGCAVTEPPAPEQMENTFQTYRSEIRIITDYLLTQEPPVSIYGDSRGLPENVAQAIKTLMRQAGCSSIHYNESAVHFVLWTRFADAGCGIAYSEATSLGLLEGDFPYLTREQPLSEQNWFYYVEDYAQWRIGKNK